MRQSLEEIFGQRKIDLIHSACVLHTLHQQQKLGKYCDLKVLVGDKQYFVHRCILAAASAQLDSQINGLDTIQLVGVTYYGFECLLEILYSGKLHDIASLSDARFQQIVSAADALNAETVMEYCTRERGDLMSLLLHRSNVAGSAEATTDEAQPISSVNNEGSLEVAVAEEPQTEQTSNNVLIKTEVTEPPPYNNETDDRAAASVAGAENRAIREFDPDYTEASVAAEVEVGNFHGTFNEGNSEYEMPAAGQRVVEVEATNEQIDEDGDDDLETETTLTCRVCGAVFLSTADLKTHMHSHVGEKLFKCEICGLHFKFQANLWKHKKIHKVETTCQICGADFKVPKELQNHIEEEHHDQITNFSGDGRYSSGKQSRSRKAGITPSMERNKSAGESLISPVVVNDIMRGEDGKYQCPLCDRGFDRRWNLKCHVLIHTAAQKKAGGGTVGDLRYLDGGFSCPECGKPFRNLHNLRRHASSMHSMNASDLAEASESNRDFAAPQTKRPKMGQRKSEAPGQDSEFKFWCTICGRGFKRNRNLRGHMETHENEGGAKYDCHICGRKFAQKESLNGHLWVHGGGKGEDAHPDD